MFDRKLLLRVMLWSLGIAAVTGVLAILTGGENMIARVTATGIITAVACLLMLGVSKWVDRRATRAAGLLGMTGVLVEFILSLAMTWGGNTWLNYQYHEMVGLSIVCVAWALLPGMWLTKFYDTPPYRIAARVGWSFTGSYFVVSMLGIWLPGQFWHHQEWWQTAWLLFLAMPVFVIQLIGLGHDEGRHWRWLGVVSGVVGCIMGLWGIWTNPDSGPAVFVCVVSVAIVVALMNIALRATLKPGQDWLRLATMAMVVITAVVIDLVVIIEPSGAQEEVYYRISGSTGIMSACGLLALAILARFNRQVDYEPVSSQIVDITVHCPRCHQKQNIKIGDSECCSCQLRIFTRIEEPRCPECGYLLYQLTSGNCPECGTALKRTAT